MGWHLTGEFKVKDKVLVHANFDILKEHCLGRSAELENFADGYVTVKDKKFSEDYTTRVYTFNCGNFSRAFSDNEVKLKKEKTELDNLLKIKTSVDYYKLTDVERERFDEDFESKQETIEFFEERTYALNYMVNLFNFYNFSYWDKESECFYDDEEVVLELWSD